MRYKSIIKNLIPYTLPLLMLMPNLLFAKQEAPLRISWKHQDNKIILTSVCFNYKYGSINYRKCRSQAKTHFKKKCAFYTKKVKDLKYPYSLEYTDSKDMYCDAARALKTVS